MDMALCEAIISKLVLSDIHKQSLKSDRGFDDRTIDILKFRSCGGFIDNDQWFSMQVPLEIHDALHKTNIVIPYFDPDGKIIYIRPHKFGVAGESVQIYIPYPIMGENLSTIVIAESEFKAIASCLMGIPAIGIPGIASFSKKNFPNMVSILKILAPKKIVICFDNEIKNDPSFPNFKPDYTTRYDTEFYTYVMGQLLRKEGFDARIARLKDEWRKEGKADVDGCLAQGIKHEDYKDLIDKSVSPSVYRESWNYAPQHLSFIERRIEKFFYGGPVLIKHSSYYSKSAKGEDKLSNFIIDIIHTIYDNNSKAERLCRFISRYGNSITVKLSPDVMVSKQMFQKFCYELGDYEFEGSDNDLKDIWSYIFMCQDGKKVIKLSHYGYSEEWNTWFFKNGAYHNGFYYQVNDDNIVWVNDVGFMLMDNINELTEPVLSPDSTTIQTGIILEKMSAIFGENEAKMLLGWAVGSFFMPEILNKFKVYPFLFLYGKQAGGKSTIANWISSFFGFQQKGINFRGSSVVGLTRTTSQMSMIPVWLEEYRSRDDANIAQKNNFLRNVYDKTVVVKGTRNENEIKTYKARSTLLVSGEECPSDSALLSRCLLFPVYEDDQKRKDPSNYEWLQANMSRFNAIGHYCLINKKELWAKIQARMMEYIGSFDENGLTISSRNKIHSSIIGGICDIIFGENESFSIHLGDMAIEQERRVRNDQALYIFFEDLYNYYMSQKISSKWIKVSEDGEKKVLVMALGSIYAEWEILTKGLRSSIPAAKTALLEHIKREPYFVVSKPTKIEGKTMWCHHFSADHKKLPVDLVNLVAAVENEQMFIPNVAESK